MNQNEVDKSKMEILKEFDNSIKNLNNNEGLSIKLYSIQDEAFSRKYSVTIFPQLYFFRNGRFVLFNGNRKFLKLN